MHLFLFRSTQGKMADTTPIYLSKKLKFPITVTRVVLGKGAIASKYTPLFYYTYKDLEPIPLNEQDELNENGDIPMHEVENVGTFESPLEGSIANIHVKKGDVIKDSSSPIFDIIEACTHAIQYGGLCAICGASVENEGTENDRAPITMDHGTTNLKVSNKEAERIERSSTERLLEEKRLSLVVDLDQTVIHVTVDPTVSEWMADPTNPNYNSVKDVKPFLLEEHPFVPHGYHGPALVPNKRWYFCKTRPGLAEFLEKISKLYELHIYTMATRQYAIEIAKIIDPDGIYFGDRILSRDESGSLTQKSLQRLFPVDTSMVVVIDDRGDVWNWSPNLIKVIPYDFFLGIGDINSSFLPKNQTIIAPSKRRASVSMLEEKILEDNNTTETTSSPSENVVVSDISSSPIDRMMALTEIVIEDQEKVRSSTLEQQEHDRPLAKLQKNLDKIIELEEGEEPTDVTNSSGKENKLSTSKEHRKSIVEPHNLLSDDDNELETLGQALYRIHNEFYFEVEESKKPDVKDIMTLMKSLVFKDCVFLLSGILPQNTNLDSTDIVICAKSFGATFVQDYKKSVTHVICKNSGTLKVRLAKSVDPNVKIVNPDWLFACMSFWDRVPVDDYIVKVDNLLSKAQVADWFEFHSDDQVHASDFNWNEIDDEINDFLGSDEEDEEAEEEERDDDNVKNGSIEHDDDQNDEKRKLDNDDKDSTDDHKRLRFEKDAEEEDDENSDDFEAELLADLESLDDENNNV